MNHMFYKIVTAIFLICFFVILLGCSRSHSSVVNAIEQEPTKIAAWMVYWDLDAGEKDLKKLGTKLETLSYFGAYFDLNGHLFVPKELSDHKEQPKKTTGKYETYLTFINDKQNVDGTLIMKDTTVLQPLFSDDVSMDKHIDEIITLTLQGKYDGIEIDYERIWKDEQVRQSFLNFANKLYVKAQENNLKLRIILEPSTPFSSADFFEGPNYVVMLYNLYGSHSGPGPKANKEFIQTILHKMESLPGEKSVAFSTGGCLWGNNGEKRYLTEVEAKTLLVTYGLETKRDEESQCIVFDYKDGDVLYQVWYADVDTLNYWISIVKEQGERNVSVWRFGGNVDINKIK